MPGRGERVGKRWLGVLNECDPHVEVRGEQADTFGQGADDSWAAVSLLPCATASSTGALAPADAAVTGRRPAGWP